MPRRLLVLTAFLVVGCGARSDLSELIQPSGADAATTPPPRDASLPPVDAHDASVDHATSPDVRPPPVADAAIGDGGSCAFEVNGAAQASVVGSIALAELAGSEIPFIYIQCEGTAGGTVYDFTAQYRPGGDGLQASWLSVGPAPELTNPGVCPAEVLLDGGTPTPGESYSVGEPFSMTFACPFPQEDGPAVEITAGRLSVLLSVH